MLIEVPEMGGIHDHFIDQDRCFTLWHCRNQYAVFFDNDCVCFEVPILTNTKQRIMTLRGTSIWATVFE